MNRVTSKLFVGFMLLTYSLFFISNIENKKVSVSKYENIFEQKEERTAEQRDKYFFRLTRDPIADAIPKGIRKKEIEFSKRLDLKNNSLLKTKTDEFKWREAGPIDVGGRTRALAIDITNSNRVLAGGVSGGIWETTDKGESWRFLSSTDNLLSVTTIAQDPRNGHTNTWYYAAGEYKGNSASIEGKEYTGDGIYRSTDDGITWEIIPGTKSNFTKFDSHFDYVSKIVVNPVTGSVFFATNMNGIFKMLDDGKTFSNSLGSNNTYRYSDIAVAGNGTLVAVLSSSGRPDTSIIKPGVYSSTDDGVTWTNITPDSFPKEHQRSVIAIAESNPDIVYVLTNTGKYDKNKELIVDLFKLNLKTKKSKDLSKNLPDFYPDGNIRSQCNYNFLIAVKPDDENFVIVGATNLFRSTNGFSTKLENLEDDWIGGYSPDGGDYFNHHPDQHIVVFDKKHPKTLWSGHDGGISYTADITNTNYLDYFSWDKKNNGYNVTQFYAVTIPRKKNDFRIMGGTQDNGTPYFKFVNGSTATKSEDLSSGDGAFAYFGSDKCYVSSQEGIVYRISYDVHGNPNFDVGGCTVYPKDATGQDFVTPFVVDPNNEDIMYYSASDVLWRNDSLSYLPDNNYMGAKKGWVELTDINIPEYYYISALKVSVNNPKHLLYVGLSSYDEPPKVLKIENADTALSGGVLLNLPDAIVGSNIQDIAINPENGNEILVVLSNYNIVGLYHSLDKGKSFVKVEGNLEGDENNPGPSLRAAAILPYNGKTFYFVGTSIGLYSTTALDSMNTNWTKEGKDVIGSAVVQAMDLRTSDNTIAVATHGRGIFLGRPEWLTDVKTNKTLQENFVLQQNYPNPFNPTTLISYTLPLNEKRKTLDVKLIVFDILGKKVATLVNKKQSAGNYEVNFDASNLASGVYYYQLNVGKFSRTKKMILLK